MAHNSTSEQRTGPRYLIKLPVRTEWDDDESGRHIITEGETENVGPEGALVHLPQLPDVGSRVQLMMLDEHGIRLQAVAEVLRIERNPAQPLAALQLMDAMDEWRGLIWEPAAPRYISAAKHEEDSADDDLED